MDREEIAEDLNDHYSKKTLITLLNYMELKNIESLNKSELIEMVIDNLSSETSFSKLYNKLSLGARNVLKHLTWEGISTISFMDSKYHIKLSLEDFYDNTADPFIKNFKQYYSKEILLSTGLRPLFKKQIKPKIPNLESELFKIEDIVLADTVVPENLTRIIDFIQANDIQSRELKKKLLKKTTVKFSDIFRLKDPYGNFRKEVLLRFLSYADLQDGAIKTLSNLIKTYANGQLVDNDNIDRYLFYPFVKNSSTNNTVDIFLKRGRYSFLSRIRRLNGWISINALVREQSLLEETQIFDTAFFGSLLYVKVDNEFSREHSNKISLIQKDDNETLLLKPLCRGVIFFLYSIGAVDIVINSNNKEFNLHPLETLTHFRVTQLGRKLFGQKSTYSLEQKNKTTCTFNEKRTLVSICGDDTILHNFFRRISKPIGGGHYLINYETFFSKCENERDIDYNLDRIITLLGKNPPEIWRNFISEITDRINPTYNEQELIVINFPQDNDEFINLITENSGIRSLYYLVEGYKGAFTKKNYKEFKKSLKEKGYIIN